jgi:hypothetical protein
MDNYGCILNEIPKNILLDLIEESRELETKNNPMWSGLSGGGVSKHFYMNEENKKNFLEYVMNLKDVYLNTYPNYMDSFKCLSNSVSLVCGVPWYNVQRRTEFIPNHTHDGILSYSAWIKIPYDVEKETKDGPYSSCFEFTYSTVMGLRSKILKIDKSWIGKILMFPSNLLHCVYPFYTVDDTRISLSGNILFDVNNLRSC